MESEPSGNGLAFDKLHYLCKTGILYVLYNIDIRENVICDVAIDPWEDSII